jgi:hypothetical protein
MRSPRHSTSSTSRSQKLLTASLERQHLHILGEMVELSQHEANDRWTWVTQANLSIRATTVARWKTEYADAEFSKAVWFPVGDAPPEHAVEVGVQLITLGTWAGNS